MLAVMSLALAVDGTTTASEQTFSARASSAASSRNVLYFVYDDLRPDISAYGQRQMHTPAMQRLADTGLVFERAYCQEAVCSPSRNSFTTGRRPNSTQVWNFINHFRQAECSSSNHVRRTGARMVGGFENPPGAWGATLTGGFAQCCTSCTANPACAGWSFERGNCTLLSEVHSTEPCVVDPAETAETCVSGSRGSFPALTPLPANFRKHGFMTLGGGKYYHDGCGGLGGAPGDVAHPSGAGTPPLADRALSWTDVDVQWPNQTIYTEKYGEVPYAYGNYQYLVPDDESCHTSAGPSSDYCTPAGFDEDGEPPTPPTPGVQPLADFVTYKDAIIKLRFAAAERARSGRPFFMVTGIKRPHLNWRTPPAFAELYPAANVSLPKQRTLDKSIWPGAFSVFPMDAPGGVAGDFVKSPFVSGSDTQLRELRRHYYAAVSWADRAMGKVLDELDTLGLHDSTMVVMHSDHGWHLGEYAMWEKRTNWELGVRVPLIMRVPWLTASAGQRSRALVELVDVYKTICDVMGVPLPGEDSVPVDGTSLKPILEAPHEVSSVKDVALSTFPRCRHKGMPVFGARGLPAGADNSCLEVERTDFTWMGYTMRTDRYRYTEWVRWNGSTLAPIWTTLVATELYDHQDDRSPWTDPDRFENVNLASTAPSSLIFTLSAQLHAAFGFPDDTESLASTM